MASGNPSRHENSPTPQCLPTGNLEDLTKSHPRDAEWTREKLDALANHAELKPLRTRMLDFPLPEEWGIQLKIKVEAEQPSGSHKHRLAQALLTDALANGWIKHPDNSGAPPVIVEASSGSTAISEAWYAKQLGMRFIAVVPAATSEDKIKLIETEGGEVKKVDPAQLYTQAAETARNERGHFVNQFTNAERAYNWRGGGLAKEIFDEVEPTWFVMAGGTGGSAAVFSRYARNNNKKTRLVMPDPEGSAFFCGWRDGNRAATGAGSRIEGIGRPQIEPSFVFDTVDRMMQVPNAASLAAMSHLDQTSGFPRPGGSSGTHLLGALKVVADMHKSGEKGVVVTVLCDSGHRYSGTYYSSQWYFDNKIDIAPWRATITRFLETGEWNEPEFTPQPMPLDAPVWDNV